MTTTPEFWKTVSDHRRVVVVTGAGLSVSAGLPTYRQDGQTTWQLGDLQRKMTKRTYGNHLPELWQHWWAILQAARATQPSAAHLALTQWQNTLRDNGGSLTLVTQNVDGLHTQAGSETIEFHGTLHETYDMRKRTVFPTPEPEPDMAPPLGLDGVSRKTRANIILFGEKLVPAKVKAVGRALDEADLLLMVGTSGKVWPVAGWAEEARARGVTVGLVDPHPWGGFDYVWDAGADEVLGASY